MPLTTMNFHGCRFFGEDELTEWIGKGEMILAMSFGYAEKEGYPLPRKKETDVIEVRD